MSYIYKIQTTIVMVLHVGLHHTYYFLVRTITYLTEKLKSNAKLSRLKLSKSYIHKKVLAGQYTLNSFFSKCTRQSLRCICKCLVNTLRDCCIYPFTFLKLFILIVIFLILNMFLYGTRL